jgi:hypothetical protein
MTRVFTFAALAAATLALAGLRTATAEEPKATGTVDIFSSVGDRALEKQLPGVGVIYGQKEWERLAAAWGIKEVAKVDFGKELLLVGTWRGPSFKFLTNVKNGDLTVELVGDQKDEQPGFRYRVVSLNRAGITKFQGRALPKPDTTPAVDPSPSSPLKAEGSPPSPAPPAVALSGDIRDEVLLKQAPPAGIIVSQRQWDTLVKVWGIKDVPKVDFTQNVLVVAATRGGTLDLAPTVVNGDLVIGARAARDTAPGFRWKVVAVPRAGLKTVGGQPLPRE